MRIRRLLAAVTTVALAGPALAVVATAAPASAATATHIVGSDGGAWIKASSYPTQPGVPVYGDTLSLSINVETDAGDQVFDGSLTVERQLAGQSTWSAVASSTSASLYESIKAVGNATYRVVYSGSGDFSPSSDAVAAKVQRKLEYKNVGDRKVMLAMKVSPKFRGAVKIFKQQGKKWKKFKTVRTNSKGRVTTALPAPRKGRYYWKLEIAGSKSFAKTQSGKFYTYSL